MYSYCLKHVLFIYMSIILQTGTADIGLNVNNEDDIRNSIDNIVNVIEMLREIKTDNVFALKNILGESNLRTKNLDGNKKLIDQLKLVLSLLNQRHHKKVSADEGKLGTKDILRKIDSDDDKSRSNENVDELNEINKNGGLRDYYEEYSCERGKTRCYKSCKEAYRETCDDYYCEKSLRRKLRKYCKYECRRWFY